MFCIVTRSRRPGTTVYATFCYSETNFEWVDVYCLHELVRTSSVWENRGFDARFELLVSTLGEKWVMLGTDLQVLIDLS